MRSTSWNNNTATLHLRVVGSFRFWGSEIWDFVLCVNHQIDGLGSHPLAVTCVLGVDILEGLGCRVYDLWSMSEAWGQGV